MKRPLVMLILLVSLCFLIGYGASVLVSKETSLETKEVTDQANSESEAAVADPIGVVEQDKREIVVASLLAEGAGLRQSGDFGGTAAEIKLEGQPFSTAHRFSNSVEPPNLYSLQYAIPIPVTIEKDDILLASFYARTIHSTHETSEGRVAFVLEKRETWDQSINETVSLPSEWREIQIPFKAALHMEAGSSQATLRLGFKPQTVEIAGFKIVNYKKSVAIEDLPSTPITYEGMEDDALWRQQALDRIEQLRKGDMKIIVEDEQGRPLSGAFVQVRMTDHAFRFGTAVNSKHVFSSQQYRTKVLENFNSAVMEWEMKWGAWEQDRSQAVRLYDWLEANHLQVRGHTLVWDGKTGDTNTPAEIDQLKDDPEAIKQRMKGHILDIVGSFKGGIVEWDVLNEPVLNNTIRSLHGDKIMADWFRWARETDPGAKLFVNETQILGVEAPVIDQFSSIVESIIEHGGPLDGIGIQAHFGSTPVNPMDFYDQLTHFAQYVDSIAITEFDMNTPREELQGKFTRDLLIACFSHPAVDSFIMWGFWDGAHWQGNAPLYRTDWSLKPAGEYWQKLIYDTWWTEVSGVTTKEGVFERRGFYGDYDIVVELNGTSKTIHASLQEGEEHRFRISF